MRWFKKEPIVQQVAELIYRYMIRCWNCHDGLTVRVPKGVPVVGLRFICDNCGMHGMVDARAPLSNTSHAPTRGLAPAPSTDTKGE